MPKRTAFIKVYVTEAEHQEIARRSRLAHMKISFYLRHLALNDNAITIIPKINEAAYRQLCEINQLLKAIATALPPEQLQEIHKEIQQIGFTLIGRNDSQTKKRKKR